MRYLLVDATGDDRIYPVALLRIGAWLRATGHEVHCIADTPWFPPLPDSVPIGRGEDGSPILGHCMLPDEGTYDHVFITTRFTYEYRRVVHIAKLCKKIARVGVTVGGIMPTVMPGILEGLGVKVHAGLLHGVDEVPLDYSFLEKHPPYSSVITSRGCPRNCEFCVVSKMEGTRMVPRSLSVIEQEICSFVPKVVVYDSNFLANTSKHINGVLEVLHQAWARRVVNEIDFNQGLDSRFYRRDKAVAKALSKIPAVKMLRFAWDWSSPGVFGEDDIVESVRLAASLGHTRITVYMLYNHADSPEFLYHRLRRMVELSAALNIQITSFPMKYEPITLGKPRGTYFGPHWCQKYEKGLRRLMSRSFGAKTANGQVSIFSLPVFSDIFGRSPEEFVKKIGGLEKSLDKKIKRRYHTL